jgi:chemotaxis protein methyltransferase CheR
VFSLDHIQFNGAEPSNRRLRSQLRGHAGAHGSEGSPASKRASQIGETETLDPFIFWLLERAGVNPSAYRPKVLQRRLPACLRTLRVGSADAAQSLLTARPELLPAAVSALLIGVTDFFRDRAVFDFLERVAIPELLRAGRALRVYSAGVSDGQELYSIAMLLDQAGALAGSEMVGIDCRPDALLRARNGVFTAREMESIHTHWAAKYFRQEHSRWVVRRDLRDLICWRPGDLFDPQVGTGWDMILFRNVAIYLEPACAAEAWEKLTLLLKPGGFLVSGKAEKPPEHLPLVRVAHSIYKKRNSIQ